VAATRPIETPEHVTGRASAVGFTAGGDRSSLRLRPEHVALVRAVRAANHRTVVAIVAGSAVLTGDWDGDVPAVLQSWYSGMEGGHGLADVLLGVQEPGGRLPFSVPADEAHLPPFDRDADHVVYDEWHGWWLLERDGRAPVYPLGFGLGYTTFALSEASAVTTGSSLDVTGSVRNTGSRPGSDVVQVYARRDGADRSRLVGFQRVSADAGQDAAFAVVVSPAALAERDVDAHRMVVRPGRYALRVARHAADPGISLTVDLEGSVV
jgi:beta-glucosidase